MNKALWIIFAVLALVASVVSMVMMIMAAQFMEYGRFLFYMTIFIVSIEVFIISVVKTKKS